LALHERPTGRLFFSRRRPVLRWPTAHDIGDGERVTWKSQFFRDDAAKQRSRPTNKGHACFVFFCAWCFAHNQQTTFAVANANDRLHSRRMKPTSGAGVDVGNELRWSRDGTRHFFVTWCDVAPEH